MFTWQKIIFDVSFDDIIWIGVYAVAIMHSKKIHLIKLLMMDTFESSNHKAMDMSEMGIIKRFKSSTTCIFRFIFPVAKS